LISLFAPSNFILGVLVQIIIPVFLGGSQSFLGFRQAGSEIFYFSRKIFPDLRILIQKDPPFFAKFYNPRPVGGELTAGEVSFSSFSPFGCLIGAKKNTRANVRSLLSA
jgi:hypothetical protein